MNECTNRPSNHTDDKLSLHTLDMLCHSSQNQSTIPIWGRSQSFCIELPHLRLLSSLRTWKLLPSIHQYQCCWSNETINYFANLQYMRIQYSSYSPDSVFHVTIEHFGLRLFGYYCCWYFCIHKIENKWFIWYESLTHYTLHIWFNYTIYLV